MRIMKLALAALFAVLAFSAMAAASASAFHPLFLTESKAELLFSGEGLGTPTLRAENGGFVGTITCERVLVDGFALDKSTLAHRVKVSFHGKCEQNVNGSKNTCQEPIVVKESLAELGLVLGNKTVGILLIPSDGTSVFSVTRCPANTTTPTTVEGAVIGEIPELNKRGGNQYNVLLSETEQVFEAENKNSVKQNITSIELLGVSMPGKLTVKGFFGGEASEEAVADLRGDGKILICTKEPQACP
jgi:hypothetical protein